MWNRVVLLSCGMVVGWGLANYWSCSAREMPRHLYRIRLAGIIALALAIWIGWDDVPSALVALLIVALSALVSYAGRARQISSVTRDTRALTSAGVQRDPSPVVIVVTRALPEAYTGPEYWAACVDRLSTSAQGRPHWFTWPLVLRRIRDAYLRLDSAPDSYNTLAALMSQLRAQLPPEVVVLSASPCPASVAGELDRLASHAASTVLVVPIDLEEADRDDLSRQIAASGFARRGARVELLPFFRFGVWGKERADRDLEALIRETVPADTAGLPLIGVEMLATNLHAALFRATTAAGDQASPRMQSSADSPS